MNKWIGGISLFLIVWTSGSIYLLTEDLTLGAQSATSVVPTPSREDFSRKTGVATSPIGLSPRALPESKLLTSKRAGGEEEEWEDSDLPLAECLRMANAKEAANLKKGSNPEESSRTWVGETLDCFQKSTENPGERAELVRLLTSTTPNFVAKAKWLVELAKGAGDSGKMLGRLLLLKQFSYILESTTGVRALPSEWKEWAEEVAKLSYAEYMKDAQELITKEHFSGAWTNLDRILRRQKHIAQETGVDAFSSDITIAESVLAVQKSIVDDLLLQKSEDARHYLAKGDFENTLTVLEGMRQIIETVHESPSDDFELFYKKTLKEFGDKLIAVHERSRADEENRDRQVMTTWYGIMSREQRKELLANNPRIEEIVARSLARDIEEYLQNPSEGEMTFKLEQILATCDDARKNGVTHLHPACNK